MVKRLLPRKKRMVSIADPDFEASEKILLVAFNEEEEEEEKAFSCEIIIKKKKIPNQIKKNKKKNQIER